MQCLAELRHIDLESVGRSFRRPFAPDGVDETVSGDDAVRIQEQDGQERPRLPAPDRKQSSVGFDFERPQQAKLHLSERPYHGLESTQVQGLKRVFSERGGRSSARSRLLVERPHQAARREGGSR